MPKNLNAKSVHIIENLEIPSLAAFDPDIPFYKERECKKDSYFSKFSL